MVVLKDLLALLWNLLEGGGTHMVVRAIKGAQQKGEMMKYK